MALRLSKPHTLVAETRKILNQAKPDANGILFTRSPGCLSIKVSRPCLARALRIMDAVVKGCVARGWRVEVRSGGKMPQTVVLIGDEDFRISLHEQLKRVAHVLTAGEHTEKKRFPSLSLHARYDFILTGDLYLVIENGYAPGVQPRWSDGRRQRLESKVTSFLESLSKNASYYVAYQANLQEDERRRQIEREEARRQSLAIHAEHEAFHRLEALATNWQKSRLIKEYVDATLAAAVVDGALYAPQAQEKLNTWAAWAHSYADALSSPRALFEEWGMPNP